MNKVKVAVKKEFRDKYSGIKHKPGKVLEITDARCREINRSGNFVEVIKAEAKK